jgi:hypothetical protein
MTLAVGDVTVAIDFLMIHIQIDGIPACYNRHQVGLVQTFVDDWARIAA